MWCWQNTDNWRKKQNLEKNDFRPDFLLFNTKFLYKRKFWFTSYAGDGPAFCPAPRPGLSDPWQISSRRMRRSCITKKMHFLMASDTKQFIPWVRIESRNCLKKTSASKRLILYNQRFSSRLDFKGLSFFLFFVHHYIHLNKNPSVVDRNGWNGLDLPGHSRSYPINRPIKKWPMVHNLTALRLSKHGKVFEGNHALFRTRIWLGKKGSDPDPQPTQDPLEELIWVAVASPFCRRGLITDTKKK